MVFLTMDKIFVLDNFKIVLDKKHFVRADGRGTTQHSPLVFYFAASACIAIIDARESLKLTSAQISWNHCKHFFRKRAEITVNVFPQCQTNECHLALRFYTNLQVPVIGHRTH